jgi:hypothetical protein
MVATGKRDLRGLSPPELAPLTSLGALCVCHSLLLASHSPSRTLPGGP